MTKAKSILDTTEIDAQAAGSVGVWLKGVTPLVFNWRAAKGDHQLLDRSPLEGFRDSMRTVCDGAQVTFMSQAIKGAMATAAIKMEGMSKTQVGRLVWVKEQFVNVYGVPELFATQVPLGTSKMSDVRSRAIMREWCMCVTIKFVRPQVSEQAIMQLLSNGGATVQRIESYNQLIGGPGALGGIGDYLIQNGKIRIIVQNRGLSRGFGIYGGGIIDADLVRSGSVDGDIGGKVNLADITRLIDHVYLSKAETAACE